jgi:hypothetical protein
MKSIFTVKWLWKIFFVITVIGVIGLSVRTEPIYSAADLFPFWYMQFFGFILFVGTAVVRGIQFRKQLLNGLGGQNKSGSGTDNIAIAIIIAVAVACALFAWALWNM